MWKSVFLIGWSTTLLAHSLFKTVCFEVSMQASSLADLHLDPTQAIYTQLAVSTFTGKKVAVVTPNSSQQLLFVTPKGTPNDLEWYRHHVLPDTVAFGYVKGWFNGEKRRPPFHAYARVGDRMFHFLDDGTIHEQDYVTAQRELLERPFHTTTYEMAFALPPGTREELTQYYRARMQGVATIDGKVQKPPYDEGGFGQLNEEGTPLENCVTFALSFTQSHWAKDYPKLATVQQATGATPQAEITAKAVSQLFMEAKPAFITVWSRPDANQVADPVKDMLDTLKVTRFYRVKTQDIRTTEDWSLAP